MDPDLSSLEREEDLSLVRLLHLSHVSPFVIERVMGRAISWDEDGKEKERGEGGGI